MSRNIQKGLTITLVLTLGHWSFVYCWVRVKYELLWNVIVDSRCSISCRVLWSTFLSSSGRNGTKEVLSLISSFVETSVDRFLQDCDMTFTHKWVSVIITQITNSETQGLKTCASTMEYMFFYSLWSEQRSVPCGCEIKHNVVCRSEEHLICVQYLPCCCVMQSKTI